MNISENKLYARKCEIKVLSNKEIKVYGFGSDGMVGASKNFMKVLGEKENQYVQGYFEYDSKKSGGVTISHLRMSNKLIKAFASNLCLRKS